MNYAAKLAKEKGGGYVVTFRDIPEAITQGDTKEEALAMALDALITAMDFYFEDKRPVPAPSKARAGERLVQLPPSVSAKVLLLNEMVRQKVTASQLSRLLGMKRASDAQRLTDLHHATKIDAIAEAMDKLGKRLTVRVC
ncbi:MAG TPA: type II toxin-antitoxin system HicB family antitoxin [Gallionellaceae bacterium]|nr:type II toxin-antitoxin system HicB family antitoxin [Gallionellaceae bacterium]